MDGSLVRPTILISDSNIGVEGLALRPDRTNPQAMFLTRLGFGADGIHAGIVNLRGKDPGQGQDPTILPRAVDDSWAGRPNGGRCPDGEGHRLHEPRPFGTRDGEDGG